jgi:hypothetical protein
MINPNKSGASPFGATPGLQPNKRNQKTIGRLYAPATQMQISVETSLFFFIFADNTI